MPGTGPAVLYEAHGRVVHPVAPPPRVVEVSPRATRCRPAHLVCLIGFLALSALGVSGIVPCPTATAQAASPPPPPDEPTHRAGPEDVERDYVYIAALEALASGRVDDAIDRLTALLEHVGPHRDASLLLARALLERGEASRVPAVLSPLLQQSPGDARAHEYLGQAALYMGNLAVAARETRRAAELSPAYAGLWARLGTILWQMDEFDSAAEAFARACDTGRLTCTEARMAAAWQAFQATDPPDALHRIETIRKQVPPGPERRQADTLLATMIRTLYERLSPDPPRYARFVIGTGYDSNPIYDPNEPLLKPPGGSPDPMATGDMTSPEGPGAPYARLVAAAGGTPVLRSRVTAGADLSLARTTYLGDDQADDFDSLRAHAVVRGRWRPGRARRHDILVRYLFDTTTLDGGPLVEEETLYVFSETHAGDVRWTLSPSDTTHLYLDALAAWEGYRDIRRVGTAGHVDFGANLSLAEGDLKLYTTISWQGKRSWIAAYDQAGAATFLGCSWRGPWRLDLAGTVQYAHRVYPRSADYEPWGETRADRILSSRLVLARRFGAHGRLEMVTRYTWHGSTIAFYDYEKLTLELALSEHW